MWSSNDDDGNPQPFGPLWNLDPNRPTPAELVSHRVCEFRSVEEFARALYPWHSDVHGTVGGTMSNLETSPAAPIFWYWHAFIDDLYEDYKQCNPTSLSSGLPSLGGTILGSPTIRRNADGRLEIFAVGTDNRIWHIWQTSHSNGWSGWDHLGDLQVTGRPSIILTHNNRIELFVRGRDRAIWHIWQTAPSSNEWSGWDSLGGAWSSNPAVAMNQDGRLEVFVRGVDNVIAHRNQMWAGGNWSTVWEGLGDNMMGNPTVGRNADGRLEFFIRRNDGVIMHRWQQWPGGHWSGLGEFDGVGSGDPVVMSIWDASLEVFVRGTDAAIWHIWQTAPSNGWSGWHSLDGLFPLARFPPSSAAMQVESRCLCVVRTTQSGITGIPARNHGG